MPKGKQAIIVLQKKGLGGGGGGGGGGVVNRNIIQWAKVGVVAQLSLPVTVTCTVPIGNNEFRPLIQVSPHSKTLRLECF